MSAVRHIIIGIRSQTVIIVALSVLWWMSLFHDAFFDGKNLFWIAIGYFFPFVLLMFLAILLASDRKTGCQHMWLIRLAFLAAMSVWLCLLALFLSLV